MESDPYAELRRPDMYGPGYGVPGPAADSRILSVGAEEVDALVAAGNALAAMLEDITYEGIDEPDWWDDLETRIDRWRRAAAAWKRSSG